MMGDTYQQLKCISGTKTITQLNKILEDVRTKFGPTHKKFKIYAGDDGIIISAALKKGKKK